MNLRSHPLTEGWFPFDRNAGMLFEGDFCLMNVPKFGIYMNRNYQLSPAELAVKEANCWSVTSAMNCAYFDPWWKPASPQTFFWKHNVDEGIWWLGVTEIQSCGTESSAADWFQFWVDADGRPHRLPQQDLLNVRIKAIAGGKISFEFDFIPGHARVTPSTFRIYEKKTPSAPCENMKSISYVASKIHYNSSLTPINPSGYLRFTTNMSTNYEGKNPVELFYKTDALAPSANVYAEIS
jgi:hypothetical protein